MSASGCIFGECPTCKELLWEGEAPRMDPDGRMRHSWCRIKRPSVKVFGTELKRIEKGDIIVLVIRKEPSDINDN